jgi:hypothetical protein
MRLKFGGPRRWRTAGAKAHRPPQSPGKPPAPRLAEKQARSYVFGCAPTDICAHAEPAGTSVERVRTLPNMPTIGSAAPLPLRGAIGSLL